MIPPVDQISPPARPVELKPDEFAWRTGAGRLGGESAQLPPGQLAVSSSLTRPVESKKPPPVRSPPIAYSFVPKEASAKSARCGLKAGPLDQVPVVMSRRMVAVELAAGEVPKPPAMYR